MSSEEREEKGVREMIMFVFECMWRVDLNKRMEVDGYKYGLEGWLGVVVVWCCVCVCVVCACVCGVGRMVGVAHVIVICLTENMTNINILFVQ